MSRKGWICFDAQKEIPRLNPQKTPKATCATATRQGPERRQIKQKQVQWICPLGRILSLINFPLTECVGAECTISSKRFRYISAEFTFNSQVGQSTARVTINSDKLGLHFQLRWFVSCKFWPNWFTSLITFLNQYILLNPSLQQFI